MLCFLDYSHTYNSTLEPTGKEIRRLPSPWPSIWRFITVETGPRRQAKDPKSLKTEKGKCGTGRGELVCGDRPGCPGREKTAAKEGQGRLGLRWKEDQEGRTEDGALPQLWWRPLLAGLQGVEGN